MKNFRKIEIIFDIEICKIYKKELNIKKDIQMGLKIYYFKFFLFCKYIKIKYYFLLIMNSLNITNFNTKNIHLGLEILRMLMSFWVILSHCYKTKNQKLHNF